MKFLTRIANTISRYYNATPKGLRWIYWAALAAYLLMPFDLLPDIIPRLGRLDDVLMLLFGLWALDRAGRMSDFFREGARRAAANAGIADQPVAGPAKSPHEILGVPKNADKAEIKKAYRSMLSMYHPDKFAHLGPSFETVARERTEAVIEAYRQLS